MDSRELIERYAAGSEEAFSELVQTHGGYVFRLAFQQLKNRQWAEEVTQAVFIALAQKAPRLPRNVVLSAWLFKATRLAVSNFARQEIRRQKREAKAMEDGLLTNDDCSLGEELIPYLARAVEKLPSRERDVVMLRFFENLSHEKIGAALGISADASKMRLSRALERLKTIFARDGILTTNATLSAAFCFWIRPVADGASIATLKGTHAAVVGKPTALAQSLLRAFKIAKLKSALVVTLSIAIPMVVASAVAIGLTQWSSVAVSKVQVDRSSPLATLRTMAKALDQSDAPAFLGCFQPSEGSESIEQAFAQTIASMKQLRSAAAKRFGEAETLKALQTLSPRLPEGKLASALVEIDGSKAKVLLDRRDSPITFTQAASEWKTTFGEMFKMPDTALLARIQNYQIVYSRVAGGIEAGQFQTLQAAADAALSAK